VLCGRDKHRSQVGDSCCPVVCSERPRRPARGGSQHRQPRHLLQSNGRLLQTGGLQADTHHTRQALRSVSPATLERVHRTRCHASDERVELSTVAPSQGWVCTLLTRWRMPRAPSSASGSAKGSVSHPGSGPGSGLDASK
jgi:hypothetical protein